MPQNGDQAAVLGDGLRGGAIGEKPVARGAAFIFASDTLEFSVGALRMADVVVVAAAGVLSFGARMGSLGLPQYYWSEIVLACLIAANGFHFTHAYRHTILRDRTRTFARVALVWAVTMLATIAMMYFSRISEDVSRGWVLIWAALGLTGFAAVRTAWWIWLARSHRAGKLLKNVAVVGPAEPAKRLARRIEDTAKGDIRILGVFRSGSHDDPTDAGPHVDDLCELARHVRIDEVIIAIPCGDSPDVDYGLRTLGTIPVDVKISLDLWLPRPGAIGNQSISAPYFLLSKRPMAGWRNLAKRSMDVALSAAALASFWPLMLAIAVLIKLDSPGPVLFRQLRFGFNKQRISVYKFRTMYCDAAADLAAPHARRNDPRVTPIGRFLRRTSLDETPQLLNVLAGDMSLVGPRPHALFHDERYAALIDGYLARHRVRPGITGWAQVNGFRGEIDTLEKMKKRIDHDLFYIDHWSLWLDIKILFLTLLFGFFDRNAY
jgi:Undecaprenyl-phosphate glucose phosphotransferase